MMEHVTSFSLQKKNILSSNKLVERASNRLEREENDIIPPGPERANGM